MYRCGFLTFDDSLRTLQGLDSQRISNSSLPCIVLNQNQLLSNPYYNSVYLPLRPVYVDYDVQVPDNQCPCLLNNQSI